MIEKSRGIVFSQLKYSETSIITTIYTEKFGRLHFIVNGARNPKGKIKANIFQPLALIDFNFYYNNKKEIQRIKEIQLVLPFKSIPFNIYKCSIALFIAEILEKSIKEEESNCNLFDFIYNSVLLLDSLEDNFSNFHLNFLIQLTKQLGFYPRNNFSETDKYFNLKEGIFVPYFFYQSYCLDEEISKYFYYFIASKNYTFGLNQTKRNLILEKILTYYYLHLEGIREIKSFKVLNEVFENN